MCRPMVYPFILSKNIEKFFLCLVYILCCGVLVIDKLIGRVYKVSEVGIVKSLTFEGLTGGVYVLSAYLEEAVVLAKLHKTS